MTRVVAQVVYQLDMDELPLKKLEKHQNKGQGVRGRSRSNVIDISSNRRKTFSQGLLLKSVHAGKSHPVLNRSGSKRERFLSGGSSTSHRSVHPNTTKVTTGESQLGDMSAEPLLVNSTVSLVYDSTRSLVDRQSSTSSQQQVDNTGRRGSEPITSTVDHPLLAQTYSVPSNTPSPLPTNSPLITAEHRSPWEGNDCSIGNTPTGVEQQPTSAFVPTLQGSDFILTNEHAIQPQVPANVHEHSPSAASQPMSENTCTTPETRKRMMKAFSVDDTRQRQLADDCSSSHRLLSSPDSFSSDILPDRSGSIRVRRVHGRREQSITIHEEKTQSCEGQGTVLE